MLNENNNTLDYIYAVISVLLIGASIVIGLWLFIRSYCRAEESIVHLGQSIKFYFMKFVQRDYEMDLGVNSYSEFISWDNFFAKTPDGVSQRTIDYWSLFINKKNFMNWLGETGNILGFMGKISAILVPSLIFLWYAFKRWYFKPNNKYNKDTKPLKLWKRIDKFVVQPIKNFIKGYVEYLTDNTAVIVLFGIVWAINLNVFTILFEFLAFYFYFVMTFKVADLYTQLMKLIMDMQVIVRQAPIVIPIVFIWIFAITRRARANSVITEMEDSNKELINELPIVSMVCGSMGKKKTTLITDMALTQEVMFRQKALELIQDCNLKFPHFPWLLFELDIQRMMGFRQIYNLATAKAWIQKKRARYEKEPTAHKLYNYDRKLYPYEYYDALKVVNIWDILESYPQLYLIYIIQSTLLVSNYSIREDNYIYEEGNFPLWNFNFFSNSKYRESRHAHILDFDALRLGKQVIENNAKTGSFEFGVVNISEVGKERGNTLELKEVKKGEFVTNQKNDLFNSWLKMCRHSATVENYPFIKVFTDEQRPESWGADARDLCDILTITEVSQTKFASVGYLLEGKVYRYICDKFLGLYTNMRYLRGDNTLFMYLFKSIAAFLYKQHCLAVNKYGYSVAYISREKGTMEGDAIDTRYYVINKKIYADRFSTDCFSDYFNDRARQTKVGLDDYEEYMETKARVEELKMQNSYFINSLYKED